MTIKSLQCRLNTMPMIPWYSYWQTEGVYTLTVHVSSDVDPHWLPLPIRIRILDPYRPPYGSGSRSSSIIGVVRIRKKCSYKANMECKPSIQRYSTVSYLIFFFMFFTLFWRFFNFWIRIRMLHAVPDPGGFPEFGSVPIRIHITAWNLKESVDGKFVRK